MRFMVATGGTGGHIFPASAFVEYSSHECLIISDQKISKYLSKRTPANLWILPIRRFHGVFGTLLSTMSIARCLVMCYVRIFKFKPTHIIGFGGYSTIPLLIAGCVARIPVILHEQNVIIGRVNKLFLKLGIAHTVATSLPLLNFTHRKIVHTGPLFSKFVLDAKHHKQNDQFTILITGGSQGAEIFSKIIPSAISELPDDLRNNIVVYHQAPENDVLSLITRYKEIACKANVTSFVENMPKLIAMSHFVIARAGATSIAEISYIGRPAMYVPYPNAKDDHQSKNAEYVQKHGACITIDQKSFTVEYLTCELTRLMQNQDRLRDMSSATQTLITSNGNEKMMDRIRSINSAYA